MVVSIAANNYFLRMGEHAGFSWKHRKSLDLYSFPVHIFQVESPKEPAFINWYREVTVPFEEDEAESPLATSRNYKNHQHRRHRIYYEECRQNTGTGNQKKVLKPIRMSDEYQTTMTMLGPGITKVNKQLMMFSK